ncbi:MAG: acetylglutamate kinase [Ktedonobacteraceae bacterium]|nr:acetylglutamate kinase [Ktedonobacteraceae bacterium]
MSNSYTIPAQQDETCGDASSEATGLEKTGASHYLKGKVLVVKLGGSTLAHQKMVISDLISLQRLGLRPVLVHGGGPSINAMLEALHIPTHFERGLRVTDEQTLEVVCMVLRGQINEHLVLLAASMGGKAVGLCGTDGNMLHAHIADEHLGFVGEIDMVDPTIVQHLLDQGYLPIIAPLGRGDGCDCLNINADQVAAALAQALSAERLVFLSDVEGIRGADSTCIAELSEADAHRFIEQGVIHGGMIPKVTSSLRALEAVPCVHIVDGSEPHILLHEFDQHRRCGTMVVRNRGEEGPSIPPSANAQ